MKRKVIDKNKLLRALRNPITKRELIKLFPEFSLSSIQNTISRLRREGYNIDYRNGYYYFDPFIRRGRMKIDKKIRKFGAMGDTHLGSKYERLDVLEQFYNRMLIEGVDAIFHTGDLIQGVGVYPSEAHDLKKFTIDEQVKYAITHYPKTDTPTYIIAGNHDLRQYEKGKSPNPLQLVSSAREDIIFLGNYHAQVEDKTGLIIDLHHPKGKPSYALSYKLQRRIEKLSVDQRPHIALSGHTHDAFYMYYSGIHVFKTGTFQDENDFTLRLGLVPALGGWLIEVEFEEGRIINIKIEWVGV